MLFGIDDTQFEKAKLLRSNYERCEDNDYLNAAILIRSKGKEEIEQAATKLETIPELGAYKWKFLTKVLLNLE